jgi:hypothetical protein
MYLTHKFSLEEMTNMLESIEKENSNPQVRESIWVFNIG